MVPDRPERHDDSAPAAPRVGGGLACAAGVSFVLLLVLTGTVAAAGPGGLTSDSGRRSAAMLMATLQEAAKNLADAHEQANPPRRVAVATALPVVPVSAQTPRHLTPPRPTLCVLPPPAS